MFAQNIYGLNTDTFAVQQNAVGRLLTQEDATGVQVFGYGLMGEVTKNLRSVAVAGFQSYWFYTVWKYDSWNRVQEIFYPDQERVSYSYNTAGALNGISSTMDGISNVQPIVSSILYDDYGDRSELVHGNGTHTYYSYDSRRRLKNLVNSFTGFQINKIYAYDALSNITGVTTSQPTTSLPAANQIGGPVNHIYEYDEYNRLFHATGNYTGPKEIGTPYYIKQSYDLVMEYNTDHTIKKKTQVQNKGLVSSYGGAVSAEVPVYKNSYVIDYADYAKGAFVAGSSSYGYMQPHAPRTITESPGWVSGLSQNDPLVKHKEVVYDANGNQLEIKEKVGELTTSLRKNLWDEENRLIAVDLKPDDKTGHPIAIYTYDAAGERTVRYNVDRMDVSSNATEVAQTYKDNVMMYPSGLIMGKALHNSDQGQRIDRMTYTKHYYIGSERISAKTGTVKDMGLYPASILGTVSQLPNLNTTAIRSASTTTVTDAVTAVKTVYTKFGLPLPALNPMTEGTLVRYDHIPSKLNIYYFHPDHLGSAAYITNAAGTVSQHMEYLPFGETLVDEHTNSFNSPFKFNGKEFDEETGNYYYSARYYDPKWSIFISVDPLAEKTMDAYGYCYQNPVRLTDPTGMSAEPPTDYYNLSGSHVKHVDDGKSDKKMVLTFKSNEKAVDAAIEKGYVVSQFTEQEIEKMDKIYEFGATDKSNTEQGFMRGTNGKSSKIVTGKHGIGKLDSQAMAEAREDLANQGSEPISDSHLHPNTFDNSGKQFGRGLPKPSDTDINSLFSEPSLIQGYEEKVNRPPSGTIGGQTTVEMIPTINFYNSEGPIQSVKFDSFKKGVEKMNKHNP